MLKKLLALLIALLVPLSALAEMDGKARVLAVIQEVLKAEEITYDVDAEYYTCYFAVDLTAPSILGAESYVDMFAYEDGVNVVASYSALPPEASQEELIRLCNCFNAAIYLGKFYINPYQDTLCYELHLPFLYETIGEQERTMIADYLWTAIATLDYYQVYFLEVIENGEKAEHVLAMWEADEY